MDRLILKRERERERETITFEDTDLTIMEVVKVSVAITFILFDNLVLVQFFNFISIAD